MATVAAVNSLGGYAYNPRGNLWANDDSTFGHKLLLKMGWSKGKGLGKREDGIKENIKVKVKGRNSGVGWKEKSHLNIQSTDYDSLLQSLSAEHSHQTVAPNKNNESASLEQRAQTFRNRLHYRRFIRGKDISRYSEKDMKSIFILNKTSEEDEETNSSSIKKELNSESKLVEMETYKSQLNMSDYFAMKMKGKKSDKISRMPDSNLDAQPTFPDVVKVEDENSVTNNLVSSGKKRKKMSIVSVNGNDINSIEKHAEIPLEMAHPNKKIKKSKKNSFSNDSVSDTNITCAIPEMHDKLLIPKKKKKKHSLIENECLIEDSVEILSKDVVCQKNENNFEVNLAQSAEIEILELVPSDNMGSNNNNITCDIIELHNDKPSSNKKRKKSRVNGNMCISSESVPTNSANYQKSESNFNVDSNQSVEIEILEPALSDNIKSNNNNDMSDIIELHIDKPTPSKKRRKKHANENISIPLKSDKLPAKSESNFEVDLNESVEIEILEPALSDNIKSNDNNKACDIIDLHSGKSISSKSRKNKHVNKNIFIPSESVKLLAISANNQKVKQKNNSTVDSTELESIEILESDLSSNTSPVREQKKAKSKRKHLKKLKTCLKSRSGKYSLKNVSFNKTVSFRIIDSDYECNSDSKVNETDCIILDVKNKTQCITLDATDETKCITLDAAANEAECNPLEAKYTNESADKAATTSIQEIKGSEQIVETSSITVVEEVPAELEVGCSLSNLPSSKSSYYNEWVESQRQALRMEKYKDMLKNIQKHEGLRTTNMLSIRGYGNWGY